MKRIYGSVKKLLAQIIVAKWGKTFLVKKKLCFSN